MQVAQTILAQLGGPRFIVMTGSKHFVGDDTHLRFKVGTNPRKITHVQIRYMTSTDTYLVTFMRVRGLNVQTIAEFPDVYADMLQLLFTENTGLYTRL